jgi:alpha-L-rhamnosidase
VNGTKADTRVLAPALTRLDKRVLYMTYDLAPLLRTGANTIALWTGPGWSRYSFFKTRPALRVQFNARCVDGKIVSLASDKTWRSEISSSENLGETQYGDNGGEKVDARKDLVDWNAVGFDDSRWPQAAETSVNAALSAQMMEATRVIETVKAIDVLGSGPAYQVVLAKNFTGWLDIRMNGQAPGDVITIKIANQDKTAQDFGQKSQYVSKGQAGEAFRNRFNFSAGRYVTLEGLKARPQLADVTGYAVATDLKRTGHFACSKELFNQIYETDLWTYRANTIEGYTCDCPHRERLGYGEESFANAWGVGLPNYQSGAFYMKHIRDWSDVQEENGWIQHTAPQVNQHYGGPMWSSAGLNITREFYRTFGDRRALETTYPSGKRWLEFLASKVQGGLLRNYDEHWGKFLGDWAAPGQRRERGDSPQAEFFNNCVYAMNLATFVEIAKVLDKPADVARYGQRLKELKTAVHARYFLPNQGIYSDGTQVQLAFPLLTAVTPENLRPAVVASFDREIAQGHPYLDMGSSGLPVLLKYLIEETDGSEYLFAHLSKTNEPSYGYFLRCGESTWPEYWNVDVPSRIHTCYTGIASWFIKGLGGIRPDPDCPGYQAFIVKPAIVGDLTFAEAATESPYGPISSRWERHGDVVTLAVTIPPNSQATIYVPTSDAKTVTESGTDIRHVAGITLLAAEKRYVVLKVESGRYTFSSEFRDIMPAR